jgi:hypothetical protein
MTSPAITVNLSASVNGSTGIIAVGDVLVPVSGVYVLGTTANRATGGRSHGIALTAWGAASAGAVRLQHAGIVDADVTGLGVGTASWVRVSSAGRLERCTPGVGDDVVGRCFTDGTAFVLFGQWDSTNYAGGGGGFTAPTGTGLMTVTSGAMDAASSAIGSGFLTWAATPSGANLASLLTTALPASKGGTGLTAVGSALQILRTDAGATTMEWATLSISIVAGLGTGVATFLGTPSGANLASALTTALPSSKGGTGLTSLGSGVATFLGTPSGANLASALTTALPVTKGGTGLTALGSALQILRTDAGGTATEWATLAVAVGDVTGLGAGVGTFLATPSGANLASALTTALPDTKGGTGLTALGTGVATFLGTPSGANLASALTSALPDTKGGTGITALGAGVATFLGTPSGANLGTALTGTLAGAKVAAAVAGVSAGTISAADQSKLDGLQKQGAAQAVSALDIDWSLGGIYTKTLAAGANTFTFSNVLSGRCISVIVTGAASTLTWPAAVNWAGGVAPTQTASGRDVYTLICTGSAGLEVFDGSVVQDMS